MKHLLYLPFFLVYSFNNLSSQAVIQDPFRLQGLSVGDSVSDFSTVDQNEDPFVFSEALKEGPLLLIFYRGQWCPFCNKHLSDLQDSLPLLRDLGLNIVAVSPEKPTFLDQMSENNKLDYRLIYDEGYQISYDFQLLFNPKSSLKKFYNERLNANLSFAHDDERAYLPIPATYLIDKEGFVLWRHFDPNYKNRSTVLEIINFLKSSK